MTIQKKLAWATLVTADDYVIGAKVLRHSLSKVGSPYPLVIMYSESVSPEGVRSLAGLDNVILRLVTPLLAQPHQKVNYAFERFKEVWSKMKAWELTDFEVVTFLDSDMLVLQNMDELFDLLPEDKQLVASAGCCCNPMKFAHYPKHWIPENCPMPKPLADQRYFNSGMFVFRPSLETMDSITERFHSETDLTRFMFADQDFLNEFFADYSASPLRYNALRTAMVHHADLWDPADIKNIHYVLSPKPWKYDLADPKHQDDIYYPLFKSWWDVAAEYEPDFVFSP
ncbi:LPS:glycosyltransferase [Polychytrium aggregatum]|uniref:LPS:glycosyltransferase n=1 Tax=Polychytrium aggregatum TaxID=110093 RepID=UPI0022FEC995|nr:LPS:glycosyltransferase [Polychytrium aggregatum]KAI9201947.1 LPS:glycosyltransferase [Polychytrium aggregatum]